MRVVRSSQNFANTEFLEVCKDHSFLGLHGSPCLLDTWDAIASRGGGLLIFLSPPTTEGWWGDAEDYGKQGDVGREGHRVPRRTRGDTGGSVGGRHCGSSGHRRRRHLQP